MELHFLSRSAYRELRLNNAFEDFAQKFDGVYIVPEGGANLAGAKGCAEIIDEFDRSPAHIVLAGGTGTTAAGLLMAISPGSTVHLIPVLKGGAYLREPIASMLAQTGNTNKIEALHIHSEFHCGGYGKATIGLLAFKKKFESATEIRLDRIYTAKAMWAMVQLMELGVLPSNGEAVFLHTGGLQGDTPV
jgi:1-aminocyclopropane-1-carboxylate deaminase